MAEPVVLAVTGASGFVGRALCEALTAQGHAVRPLVRTRTHGRAPATAMPVGNIDANTDWTQALRGVDCVVHCAARVHVMRETAYESLAQFRAVNTEGTRALAQQASAAGVRRLVFVSSIKVLGESTEPLTPFTATDLPQPQDAYGQSKWEAEQALHKIGQSTGLQVVVVRPTLVYGPGVGGNFRLLARLAASGLPLPLGAINNRRSLIALDNLVHLLALCTQHPAALGHTFLASDGDDPSTPQLVQTLASAQGKSARLLPVPMPWLRMAGQLAGRGDQVDRLVDSLQVDDRLTRTVLGWAPIIDFEEGIRRTVGKTPT